MTAVISRHLPAPVTDRDIASIERQIEKVKLAAHVPEPIRGKVADLMLVGLKGRELGIDRVTVALQHIVPIKSQLCLSAQLCVALARRRGHDIWAEDYSPTSVTVAGILADKPGRTMRVTWTIGMAKTAELEKKDNWRHYPQAMLFARASKDWVKMNCPEVMMGLDDGTWHLDDLVDTMPEEDGAGGTTPDGAPLVDDDTAAEGDVLPPTGDQEPAPSDWPQQWAGWCRQNNMSRATSAKLLTFVCGVTTAADVPEDKRAEAEQALDAFLQGQLDLGPEDA